MAMKNRIITVQDIPITVSMADEEDYICITDMAAAKSDNSRAADVIRNWLRNRSTLEFLSTWEEMYNPNFKVFESEHFKKDVGLVTFTPSVSEWVEKTDAIGLFVKKGRYGGTFAYKDIAFEFASAISPVFKLYLIREFQRLKTQENDLRKIEWDAKRFLSKNNYLIQRITLSLFVTTEKIFSGCHTQRKQIFLMLLFLDLLQKLGGMQIQNSRGTVMLGTMLLSMNLRSFRTLRVTMLR